MCSCGGGKFCRSSLGPVGSAVPDVVFDMNKIYKTLLYNSYSLYRL